MGYNNQTNGIFDIEKESVIVGDIVVDALMHPKLISHENSDRASGIAIQKFLEFRKNQAAVASMHTANIKMKSNNLATVIIAALIDAGLINEQSRSYAF